MKLPPEEETRYQTILVNIRNHDQVPREDFVWAMAIRKSREKWEHRQRTLRRIGAQRLGISLQVCDRTFHGYNTGPR